MAGRRIAAGARSRDGLRVNDEQRAVTTIVRASQMPQYSRSAPAAELYDAGNLQKMG
jgi:hypothetical protein